MNTLHQRIIKQGLAKMRQSDVTICSIVRDCNKNLVRNVRVIEKLRCLFKTSHVIVIENDSVDGTKDTLENWKNNYENIIINVDNYNTSTIPDEQLNGVNKYYSFYRISKLAEYRNKYLRLLNSNAKYNTDFVVVVDLDVAKLNINGVIHSFGLSDEWDVICSNGYSYTPILKKRYYDSYALVELGKENENQTETSIANNRSIWSFLKKGLPLIPVYSAYGGLAIYKHDVIKNKEYQVISNHDSRVEVKCEHFSICHQIRKSGFERIFINPNMPLKYQGITLKLIFTFLRRLINN